MLSPLSSLYLPLSPPPPPPLCSLGSRWTFALKKLHPIQSKNTKSYQTTRKTVDCARTFCPRTGTGRKTVCYARTFCPRTGTEQKTVGCARTLCPRIGTGRKTACCARTLFPRTETGQKTVCYARTFCPRTGTVMMTVGCGSQRCAQCVPVHCEPPANSEPSAMTCCYQENSNDLTRNIDPEV